MLSLILIVVIVSNVVLWSYQMNQFDWEKMQEDVSIVDVRDTWSYNPSGYGLGGSTSLVSGSVSNLKSDDGLYMTFRSYYSGTDITDFVDNNTSDVGSPADRGTHSNFTAQQYGPDGMMDTLLESNTGGGEQWLSPTGYEDPGNEWANETNAYDDDAGTYAVDDVPGGGTWSQYLVLTRNAITCGKIRYYIGREDAYIDQVEIDIYNDTWTNVYIGAGIWNVWTNVSFAETSVTKMRFRFFNAMPAGPQYRMAYVYEADFLQSGGPVNYELDLEVQWTDVDYDEANEWLCVYGGTMGLEDVRVDVWNGSAWENVFTDLSSGWNNFSVSSYLESSTFTIRFKGGNETGDTTQDSWDIDVTLLHVWSDEYTLEVEFTGSSNTEDWGQLSWTVDSAWTVGSVNVTLQLYNYTLNCYPTSGNGYIAYTSDDTPNTDEVKNQIITVNPTHFRNATGCWKMKVKGVKATDKQFDLKVDWVEFKVGIEGTLFTFKNRGSLTSHLVSLWVINSTHHRRYDIDVIINSGETLTYSRIDVSLPTREWMVKVVTERGNIAIFQNRCSD